jgi:hypothetical protein
MVGNHQHRVDPRRQVARSASPTGPAPVARGAALSATRARSNGCAAGTGARHRQRAGFVSVQRFVEPGELALPFVGPGAVLVAWFRSCRSSGSALSSGRA